MQKRIIALDVGDRRIGIAVSDPLGMIAQPIETYTRVGYGPDVRHIAQIAAQYETDSILCGLPRNMDGTQGFQVNKVHEFAAKLEEQGLTVSYYDERLTTVMAEQALLEADMRRDQRKQKVDMLAAVMILQSYLDAQAAQRQQESAQTDASIDDEPEDISEDDGILEFEDEDGNVARFYLTARVEHEGSIYVMLSAAADAIDMSEGEELIMLETIDEAGDPCYQSLDDEALIEAVYGAYLSQSEE